MASSFPIVKRNTEGRYYVDESCIYCELCVDTAPENFAYDDIDGVAYVKAQPNSHDQHIAIAESIEGCPTESIGDKVTRREEVIDDMGLGAGTTPKNLIPGIFQIVYRWFNRG